MITLVYVGEFGKVYKGTWQHKTDSGDTVSQVVAVKTIKSKSVLALLASCAWLHIYPCMYVFKYTYIRDVMMVMIIYMTYHNRNSIESYI